MDNGSDMAFCDYENLIYQAEDEGEEYCEVPGEVARLLQQEIVPFSPMRNQWTQST